MNNRVLFFNCASHTEQCGQEAAVTSEVRFPLCLPCSRDLVFSWGSSPLRPSLPTFMVSRSFSALTAPAITEDSQVYTSHPPPASLAFE